MEHAYTNEQLQAAIDEAFEKPKLGSLHLPDARLKIIKSALAALPEPPTPTVDGKTPGLVIYQHFNSSADWGSAAEWYKEVCEKAASAVLAAFGGKEAQALAHIAKRLKNVTFDPTSPMLFAENVAAHVDDLRDEINHKEELRLSEMIDRQPAEIPWTEWRGGECPLKDEEVEKWEYKLRDGFTSCHPEKPRLYTWSHNKSSNDIIAYRVLKWREGFGPVDWKTSYEQMHSQAKHHLQLLSDWQTRAEKAEAELARIIEAAHEAGWNGVDNPKDLAQFILNFEHSINDSWSKHIHPADHDRIVKGVQDRAKVAIAEARLESLPQLRPSAEAGPVPEGCVRLTGGKGFDDEWQFSEAPSTEFDTHVLDFQHPTMKADVSAKPDPYAELKAAHAAGKMIQWRDEFSQTWTDYNEVFHADPGRYSIITWRIKPEPETFEAHGKTWTKHTPGDAMPCDGERKVAIIFGMTEGSFSDFGKHWDWKGGNFDGWRYADEPTPELLEPAPEPWTPKVGDVVMLKSGGPKMTIGLIKETLCKCQWFRNDEADIETFETTCLQPA